MANASKSSHTVLERTRVTQHVALHDQGPIRVRAQQRQRAALDELTSQLLYDVGWHPDQVLHVAGAVDPEQLNLLERAAVHAVMMHRGVPLDSHGPTELTDWTQVDAFVGELLARLPGRSAMPAASSDQTA